MPVSSLSTKAPATSTYSDVTTRAGTSLPASQFVGAGAQHRAQHGLDAFERPAAGERRVDLRIEAALLAHHAADDVAEIGRFRRPVLHALDFAAEPMAFEFGHDVVEAGAGKIHLVKRLHRGEAGGATLVGLARLL